MSGAAASFVDELEARARARFVRWDAPLWKRLVDGPAHALGAALAAAGHPAEAADAALRTYLELACEGVGAGYLYPPEVGRESFFSLAFWTLLPRDLATLPPTAWGERLAECWNLGENLEAAAPWLRRLFARRVHGLRSLAELGPLVEEVSRQIVDAPAEVLAPPQLAQSWLVLADEDRRFLPGPMHFLAPLVLCVHDRLRTGGGGRDAAAIAVWLGEPPLVLGPMRCDEQPPLSTVWPEPARALVAADPRVTEPYAACANAWRCCVTQVTSQFLVAISPGP
jgi:hypothetical protein